MIENLCDCDYLVSIGVSAQLLEPLPHGGVGTDRRIPCSLLDCPLLNRTPKLVHALDRRRKQTWISADQGKCLLLRRSEETLRLAICLRCINTSTDDHVRLCQGFRRLEVTSVKL